MAIFRQRPHGQGDNLTGGAPSRSSWYGDAYVVPVELARNAAAAEGSYFSCANATIDTEITGHAAPAAGDEATKPLIYIYNGGSKIITPDYIWLKTDTPNASSSQTYFAVSVTQELSRDSGGTQLTPQNARSDNPYSSGATVYVGAVVTTPSASRRVATRQVRSVIAVVEDEYTLAFGQDQRVGAQTSEGTARASLIVSFPPVAIAPGGELLVAQIALSGASTAWDGEVELGFFER